MNAQIDIFARRDLGITRARAGAQRQHGDPWTLSAATYLRLYANKIGRGATFLLEDARAASIGRVAEPDNQKAWGAAAVLAAREGWIMKCGFGPAQSSNGSPKTLWRAA